MDLVLCFGALKEAFEPWDSAHPCNPKELYVQGLSRRIWKQLAVATTVCFCERCAALAVVAWQINRKISFYL